MDCIVLFFKSVLIIMLILNPFLYLRWMYSMMLLVSFSLLLRLYVLYAFRLFLHLTRFCVNSWHLEQLQMHRLNPIGWNENSESNWGKWVMGSIAERVLLRGVRGPIKHKPLPALRRDATLITISYQSMHARRSCLVKYLTKLSVQRGTNDSFQWHQQEPHWPFPNKAV